MFGVTAPFPLRLTSNDSIHGWAASQHARMCADVASNWRTMPLAVMTVKVTASACSLVSYNGRNGSGALHAPTFSFVNSSVPFVMKWENSYEDELEFVQPWVVRLATVSLETSGTPKQISVQYEPTNANQLIVLADPTTSTPYNINIIVYGSWGDDRQIGDYGGDLNKRDNTSESIMPYVAQWYQEIKASRGSAYTQRPNTIVDAENIAIARIMSAVFSRTPEKYSANATPGRATERLDYWVNVLGIDRRNEEPDWLVRQRCAAHYKASIGPVIPNIQSAVSELLGSAFVDIETFYGPDLDNPPYPTLWPGGISDGGAYSIGGYTWLSRRSHIRINVIQPPGLSNSDFFQLMNVQLYHLLDLMLPGWVTWNWSVGSDGFIVGVDRVGIDAL